MHEGKTVHFQPISMLPTIAQMIDGGLVDGREIQASFEAARGKPHVLDDHMVARAVAYHEEALEFLPIYEEQLRHWKRSRLSADQEREVDRLALLIEPSRRLHTDSLVLLRELAQGTIEKVMGKSDLELGLEALLRQSRK